MLNKGKTLGEGLSVGLGVFVCGWIIVFLANLASIQKEMVTSPPSLIMNILPQEYTIVPQSGMVIDPQYMLDRFQYELDITNTSEKLVITHLDLRFQFPYEVDSSEVSSKDGDDDVVTFLPVSSNLRMSGEGTLTIHGPAKIWKIYKLHVSRLSPMGHIAIIFRLNGKLDPRAASLPREYAPIATIPVNERLFATGSFSFSMGGQERSRAYYAPMWLDEERTLHILGNFYRIPDDLAMEFDF